MWLLTARAPPASGASRVTLANRRFVSSVSVHQRRGTALVRCHADSDKPLGSAAVAEETEKSEFPLSISVHLRTLLDFAF